MFKDIVEVERLNPFKYSKLTDLLVAPHPLSSP
jgi:hypothetical protein